VIDAPPDDLPRAHRRSYPIHLRFGDIRPPFETTVVILTDAYPHCQQIAP
jgi:hypothetical protein